MRALGLVLIANVAFADGGTLRRATREELSGLEVTARKAAAKLSKEGAYARAAQTIDTFLAADGRYWLSMDRDSWIEALEKLAAAYRERDALAREAAHDKTAARRLLRNLLAPPLSRLDTAEPDDPRLAQVIALLKAIDPKAKAFFTPRQVKVVVAGELPGGQGDALAIGVVQRLRGLGFDASTVEGSEVLTIETTFDKDQPYESATFTKELHYVSCGLGALATWKAGATTVVKFELGGRAPGFGDISNSCLKKAIQKASERSTAQLIEAWNAQ